MSDDLVKAKVMRGRKPLADDDKLKTIRVRGRVVKALQAYAAKNGYKTAEEALTALATAL